MLCQFGQFTSRHRNLWQTTSDAHPLGVVGWMPGGTPGPERSLRYLAPCGRVGWKHTFAVNCRVLFHFGLNRSLKLSVPSNKWSTLDIFLGIFFIRSTMPSANPLQSCSHRMSGHPDWSFLLLTATGVKKYLLCSSIHPCTHGLTHVMVLIYWTNSTQRKHNRDSPV